MWRALKTRRRTVEFDTPPACYPDITSWSRESAVALTEARLDDMLGATADGPVDLYRAVHLGAEMARKQGLDVEPEACAYAADRLQSKIDRDAVYNPVTEAHAAILAYRFLKKQRAGGEVVYLDVYKLRRERAEQAERAKAGEPKRREEHTKGERDPLFKRIGQLKAKPREWLIRGFLGRNEVGGIRSGRRTHSRAFQPRSCVCMSREESSFLEWPSSRCLRHISQPNAASRRSARSKVISSGSDCLKTYRAISAIGP